MKTILTKEGQRVRVWSEQANELEAEVWCEWDLQEFRAIFPDAEIDGIKSIQHEPEADEYFVMENGELTMYEFRRDHPFLKWTLENQDRLRERAIETLIRRHPAMEDFFYLGRYLGKHLPKK